MPSNALDIKTRIAIVGAGRMGANIARRLKDVGYSITAIHDARPGAAAEVAAELGTQPAGKLSEVSQHADLVITVVTDDTAMRAIYSESADSLLSGASGKLFVNCATVSPHVHVEVERLVDAAGGQSLEACMASSITQAREGTLYLMVGGKQAAYERALPVLRAMSKDLRYVGPAGSAAQVKALVNMVMNINTAGLAEGLGLAAALGLDLTMIREVFSQTGAASRVLETDGADMQNRDHEVYFSAAHAAKDSGIALGLAEQIGLAAGTLPLARATKDQFDRMVKAGLGELDKSGIAELTFPGRGASPA
jgi:3-hydroxyisobutyrate dehydrogenase